jgi:two-component system CheB/CheR fusion protein
LLNAQFVDPDSSERDDDASSAAHPVHRKPPHSPFPIVGIGASAGGLEAFSQLLGALPEQAGMARSSSFRIWIRITKAC